MKALSYNDWRTAGYQVRRGEQASGRDRQGRPTFRRDQVEPSTTFDRPTPGQRVYNPEADFLVDKEQR